MDSFKIFMDNFERAVAERNSSNLQDIIRDGRKYFQKISRSDSESVLSTLFDKEKGLLHFLDNELSRPNPQKGFDNAIKEAFQFLEFIMEQFSTIFVPYIVNTKNTCQTALTTRCSGYIQKAACNAFNKLIELFKEYEINLGETVKTFVQSFRKIDIKERCWVFSVLGTIAKHNPEVQEIHDNSGAIFLQLQNDFKKQYKPGGTSQATEIKVYLDVLADMLGDLSDEWKQKYIPQLYEWIKTLSPPDNHPTKKVIMRSAIDLLSRHISLFCEFVYRDYKFWYSLFIGLARESNAHSDCGQRALKCFYNMIGSILKYKNSEEDKVVFLYFKNLFEEQLKTNTHVDANMLRFIVYGFSQMAAPCKRYLTNNDVNNMFSLIAHCALPLCARDDLEPMKLESICDYQEALSEIILHTSDLSIDRINIIIRLSILLVKRFPDLSVSGQTIAVSSLINTISNIGVINKRLLEEFLYNLILNGVIWTCSHTLLIDAELQRGLKNLPERPMCYKNYLPLWTQLLQSKRYGANHHIIYEIVDTMIRVCIELISKLNLRTKVKDDNVFSDAALSHIAENKEDYRIFVNIVDLYVDLINRLESFLLANTIHKFLLKTINMSYKYPLISGFYKLVHSSFRHISDSSKDEIEQIEMGTETQELLYKYIMNVLDMIPTFSNELLTTCLYLILDTPILYVEYILKNSTPAFKIAFTMGLSDFDLASAALSTLEKWTNYLDNRRTNEFLRDIVPLLEPYLQSKESSMELLQDIIKTERKVIKRIILIDDHNTLEKFQMRILLFIASLDTDIVMEFVYKRSINTGATWDKKDLLKYSLPFLHEKVDIYFDKTLPRLITLAQSSGDRRTKVIACEALHSILAYVLGKTRSTSNPDRFATLYKLLCPALLNLGCDADEVVRKIFQPLTLQLTRWLSSKLMLESPATMYLLDSLFKGLCNDSKSSLREFSGMCLAEFTKWSIKQSDNEAKTQVNIHAVIRKMTNFALHPSVPKRIAAAIAFNHLYSILREDEQIVSVYWLEILYCFVRSLDGCNDSSINNAINHVERVIVTKEALFNESYQDRRKPHDFEGVTLADAVFWLFTQCGSLDDQCRKKCMELFLKFSRYVIDCESPEAVVRKYIDTHGIEGVNHIILKDLEPKIESLSFNNISPLLASFDCCIFLIQNILVSAEELFASTNAKREIMFNCARNFVHIINAIKMEDRDDDIMILSHESEHLQTLQCKVIISMFAFLEVLLNFENLVPDFFLNNELFELISKCVMYPQSVGFDAKNHDITESLPFMMERLLKLLMQKLDESLLCQFKIQLKTCVEEHINEIFNLDEILSNIVSTELKQYVKGLIILKRCDILDELYKENRILDDQKNKVKLVFKTLSTTRVGELVRVNIRPLAMDYLQNVMELLLMHHEPSLTRSLVELISNETMLGSDFTRIAHGTYFFNVFKDIIVRYMLKDIENTMEVFDDLAQRNPSLLLTIVEDLLLFVQRHKKELHDLTEILVDTIIKKFTMFEKTVHSLENGKQKLITIYGIAVHLKQKPTEVLSISAEFYSWVLSQLTENSDLEYKIYILQNFLVCLTDMSSNDQPELVAILRVLRKDRLAMCPDGLSEKSVRVLQVINSFQTLLTLLPVTKSLLVFETVIHFAAGVGEQLCNEKTNEYLEKYFDLISDQCALKSLEKAYQLYMTLSTTTERFDVLYRFLLPLFQFCKVSVAERFFERNIKEIYTVISQGLVGSTTEIKQLIVSKIGCYDLVAKMFAKIDIENIDSTKSVITKNAIGDVKTGKELLQQLYSNALHVRMLKTTDSEHKEIMRQLHCSAYNCSIAIVCLKEDEDSYLSVFLENRSKDQLIWERIIDCDKQYNFQQTVKEYPKHRTKLINIRKSMTEKQMNRYSYIHSYNLSTSSLTEDINAYDFNQMAVRGSQYGNEKEESMSLMFECDDLNNHECMATVCGVLTSIISREISVPSAEGEIVMPKWLKCFCVSMTQTNQNNVRLFMFKIISNMPTVFQPYAKFFLSPIMNAVYSYLKTNSLNYIITDVIMLLIDWHAIALPSEGKDRILAQKLWEVIIQKVLVTKTTDISKPIYKYNLNLAKTILEVWRTCLRVPDNLEDKMKSAPGVAVYLILICFVNGMDKEIMQRQGVLEFLQKSLENWQDDEDAVLQSCECFGLILKYLDNDENVTSKKGAIIDKIQSTLRQMQKKCENRQVKCIQAICKNYPSAAMIYFEFVTTSIYRVDALGKCKCLEILLLCIPSLSVDQIKKELGYIKFQDFLKNKVSPCETVSLKIIDTLLGILPPSDLLPLAKLVLPYIKHDLSDYREQAYNIFMNIYKTFSTDTLEDEHAKELLHISKETLIDGLLDPAEELQENILKFWTQNARLANSCKERLLEILKIYTSRVGDTFLPFMLLTMLDLTNKTMNYTQKMFEPLHECTFMDYKISCSWRTKNLGSMAPLFVPSLTSQMNQTFTQMSATMPETYSNFSYSRPPRILDAPLQIRATQELEFEPTYVDEGPVVLSDDVQYGDVFKVPKVPQPVHNRKSRRFLHNTSEVSAAIRQNEIKKNIRRAEMIKEEVARQRSSVKLYRNYRIGDFPDIEISHSSLIEPLKQLAKKDQLICKDLTVSIVCSLLEENKSGDFPRDVGDRLKYILENNEEGSSIIAAILEILLATRITSCAPEIIAKVSKSNSLHFLGSLVLEENLIYTVHDSQPRNKRVRTENLPDSSNKWLQLTNLYSSMNDVDVVLSIFQNHIENDDMREASFAQAANDWTKAKTAYEKVYANESEFIKEYCLQGLFECLSNLTNWSEIDKLVHEKLNGNFNNIWQDEWRSWMFPWLFEICARKLVDDDTSDSFETDIKVLETWLKDEMKGNYVKRYFGEEIALFQLHKPSVVAREFLINTLDELREEWICLHPLSTQLRIHKLQKLRVMNDIHAMLKVMKTTDDFESILKFWSNSTSSAQDALIPWDKLTSYRLYFGRLMKQKLSEWEDNSESTCNIEVNVADKLHMVSFNMKLKMIEMALNQKNKYIACKYLEHLEKDLLDCSTDLRHQLILTGVRVKYLKGEVESNKKKQFSMFVSSWKNSHNLLQEQDIDPLINVSVRQHVCKVASKIVKLSEEDDTVAHLLTTNDIILKEINVENGDIDNIRKSLEEYGLNHLKTCCDTNTANIRECFFTLSKYCYDRLSSSAGNNELHKEFIKSTLKAMSYGSLEAAHYFPCLLEPKYFEDEETKAIFMKESVGVQAWLFLSWQAQLFSHLVTPIAPLVIPILEKIVNTYPNALIYTFRLTVETNPALLKDPNTYKIRKVLYEREDVGQFLKAMEYVVQPELYLRHYLCEFVKNLSSGLATAVDTLLKKVYPNTREIKHGPKPGNIYSEIARYKSAIQELERKSPNEVKARIEGILERLRESLFKRKNRTNLKDYSPWLYEYSGGDLEVPGQYSGNKKPMPQYHAKIAKMEPTVKVMASMRRPIRITMVGNDAKEYNFLVKFGEDLRLDQRLQQLFTIMNKTLHMDATCRQRRLSIDTYQVVPLSRTLGLIQWIDDTRSLQDLIHFTLSDEETNRYESILKDYDKWIRSAAPSKKQSDQYHEALLKYDASKVKAKMHEFISKTEWNSLRRTLTVLSPSVESFITLRRNFITSYATMCIAHWILGIGDRHLGNTLITVGSGRCLGIDFGLSFGAGVEQRIPELMPFRLTSQILGLLKPFTENDLLQTIMTHTLRALRNEQGSLLACMDVFVREPLDWTEHVNKALKETEDDVTDVKWVPKKKINVVTKKLNGVKPSLITLEQLSREQHGDKYFDRYYVIVTGNDDEKRKRATMKDEHLTPEEQVECLLDQATDLNVLGHAYVGWKPWL